MATALVQTAEFLPPPEVLAPEHPNLRRYDSELRSAARNYRQSVLKIGYYGARLRMTEGWRDLGFESEEDYRESLDVPRSTWYKYVRICQNYMQLSLPELEAYQITNLQLLLKVNPSIADNHPWMDEALALKPKKLAELVAERNRAVGDEREPLTSYRVTVPFLAKRAIEQQVEDFQKKHGLSSPGQALEFLIVDRAGEPGILTELSQIRKLLSGVAQSLQMKANRCQLEQERSWIKLAWEMTDACYQKAIQAARQESAGEAND